MAAMVVLLQQGPREGQASAPSWSSTRCMRAAAGPSPQLALPACLVSAVCARAELDKANAAPAALAALLFVCHSDSNC
jgi:hypothetical protein